MSDLREAVELRVMRFPNKEASPKCLVAVFRRPYHHEQLEVVQYLEQWNYR